MASLLTGAIGAAPSVGTSCPLQREVMSFLPYSGTHEGPGSSVKGAGLLHSVPAPVVPSPINPAKQLPKANAVLLLPGLKCWL